MCGESVSRGGENEADQRGREEEERVHMGCQSLDSPSTLEASSKPGLSARPCSSELPQYLFNPFLLLA